ncbi:MAG: ADP-ribosylglycohydrolase family protein [Myxococcota bacterium]
MQVEDHFQIRWDPRYQSPPPPIDVDPDRVAGMLWGVAIGDALGRPSEGMTPTRRGQIYGEVRGYHPHYRAKHRSTSVGGRVSDDTQLTFWTVEQLLADGALDPAALSARFAKKGGALIGIGATLREFRVRAARGLSWPDRGVASAGNGALMRLPPLLLPHLQDQTASLWRDVVRGGGVTHNDSASHAACLGFTRLMWLALGRVASPPPPGWWVETFLDFAASAEVKQDYAPRGGDVTDFSGTLCDWVRLRLGGLAADRRSTAAICDSMHSGAYLLETVPCALVLLERHGHDPEEALIRAVNDTKDSDTLGAIVGAMVGALHGRRALPDRWISGLEGRLSKHGLPGEVQALIEAGVSRFTATG